MPCGRPLVQHATRATRRLISSRAWTVSDCAGLRCMSVATTLAGRGLRVSSRRPDDAPCAVPRPSSLEGPITAIVCRQHSVLSVQKPQISGFLRGGACAVRGLIQATDGNLYGTTVGGGHTDNGTVFEITPAGTLRTLYSFCAHSPCSLGALTLAGVLQAPSGIFYGMTSSDGKFNNAGVAYSFSNGLEPSVSISPTSGNAGPVVLVLGPARRASPSTANLPCSRWSQLPRSERRLQRARQRE
jgi:uncharacterized repeat protein (TIGR03803 family)